MPIQGLTRLRKHQFGRQAAFGTKVAATRAYPFSGTPTADLQWTDPDIDVGSRDLVAPPTRGVPQLAASLTAPTLDYNSLPLLLSCFFGGAVAPTGGGTAKTWTYDPASETVDENDVATYEFGDDVLTDWFQFGDGILDSVEFTGPDGLGPISASGTWRFGSVASTGSTDSPVTGSVPTPGLAVDTTAAIVYLKDMAIYIADTYAGLAAGQVSDALHNFTLRLSVETDEKRWANGDQSFDVDAYGPGARVIELECSWAKTSDTVGTGSESDDWLSDDAVNRYVRLVFISKVLAQNPSTYYGWTVDMPMRYYTRTEGEVGQNSIVVLTGKAFFDPDQMDGVFQSVVVNTLTEAQLGDAGS